jgi:hypothetical protein
MFVFFFHPKRFRITVCNFLLSVVAVIVTFRPTARMFDHPLSTVRDSFLSYLESGFFVRNMRTRHVLSRVENAETGLYMSVLSGIRRPNFSVLYLLAGQVFAGIEIRIPPTTLGCLFELFYGNFIVLHGCHFTCAAENQLHKHAFNPFLNHFSPSFVS